MGTHGTDMTKKVYNRSKGQLKRFSCIVSATVVALYVSSCQTVETRPGPTQGLTVHSQGVASYYGKRFHGHKTASGEKFDMNQMTAAHPNLPFGSVVLVQSVATGKTVQVRINDRGPFIKNRIIDLSYQAAKALGFIHKGMEKVKIFVLQKP
ncbi:MAG: septal ring lytic transglycosylase RlpA family protein [Bdellovibrionaceae bacterium]|nr:septal ring lytic transglycosylase RlpA family protein [Bdellovibrionales bacterium]MCB9082892.1 septal ring lytic transglycosylase RlpA family protein [Pseudobdellovibrionaceae bacterium]